MPPQNITVRRQARPDELPFLSPAQQGNIEFAIPQADLGRFQEAGFSPVNLPPTPVQNVAPPVREPGKEITATGQEVVNRSIVQQPQQPQTLEEAMAAVQAQFQPLSEERRAAIQSGVAAQFAPQFSEQERINEIRRTLFGAQRAQAGEAGFGTSGLGREQVARVEEIGAGALSRLRNLQAAETQAQIAAAETGDFNRQRDLLGLAQDLRSEQVKEFQQYIQNTLDEAAEQRQRQKLFGEQVGELAKTSGVSLVGIDEVGNILPPSPEDVAAEAQRIGADVGQVQAAVDARIDDLRKLSNEDRKARASELSTQSLIASRESEAARREFLTEKDKKLLPLEEQKLRAQIAKTFKDTSEADDEDFQSKAFDALTELQQWSDQIQSGLATKEDAPDYLQPFIFPNGFTRKPTKGEFKEIINRREALLGETPGSEAAAGGLLSSAQEDISAGASRADIERLYPEFSVDQINSLFPGQEVASPGFTPPDLSGIFKGLGQAEPFLPAGSPLKLPAQITKGVQGLRSLLNR